MAAPFKVVEFDMMFDEPGVISLAGEIIDIGVSYDTIEKSGNTYTLTLKDEEEVKLGVGREKAKNSLYDDPELLEKAKNQVVSIFKERLRAGRVKASGIKEEEKTDDSAEKEAEETADDQE